MPRLLRITSEYVAQTESEVNQLIKDATTNGGELTKKIIETKQKKSKGQVVDECLKVILQVTYSLLWDEEEGE